MFNEEVQKFFEDALQYLVEQNLSRRYLQVARSSEFLWWVEWTVRMLPVAFGISLDRASSLFQSSGSSDALGCCFCLFKSLELLQLIHFFSIKNVLSEQLSLNVLSTINREVSYSSMISSNTTPKPNTQLLFYLSLNCNTSFVRVFYSIEII